MVGCVKVRFSKCCCIVPSGATSKRNPNNINICLYYIIYIWLVGLSLNQLRIGAQAPRNNTSSRCLDRTETSWIGQQELSADCLNHE